MMGTAVFLGSCLMDKDIGIVQVISNMLRNVISEDWSVLSVVAILVSWAIIETNFSSNIVTTTVVSSVAVITLPALPDISLGAVLMLIGFSAAICNMTPAGQSTINTVAISSGHTDAESMFLYGFVVSIIAGIFLVMCGYPLAEVLLRR